MRKKFILNFIFKIVSAIKDSIGSKLGLVVKKLFYLFDKIGPKTPWGRPRIKMKDSSGASQSCIYV